MELHNPGNVHPVNEIWIVLSTDEDGNEGICAISGEGGMVLPLVAGDKDRVETMCEAAEKLAPYYDGVIKLVRFDNKTIEREWVSE